MHHDLRAHAAKGAFGLSPRDILAKEAADRRRVSDVRDAGQFVVFERREQHQPVIHRRLCRYDWIIAVTTARKSDSSSRVSATTRRSSSQRSTSADRRPVLEDRGVETLLVREVAEEDRFGRADGSRDLAGRGAGEAPPREQRGGRVEELDAPDLAGHEATDRAGRWSPARRPLAAPMLGKSSRAMVAVTYSCGKIRSPAPASGSVGARRVAVGRIRIGLVVGHRFPAR